MRAAGNAQPESLGWDAACPTGLVPLLVFPTSVPSPRPLPPRQVWCALTLITEIRHRVVALRLLRLTGTVAPCRDAALAWHAALTAGRRLSAAQAKLAEEANGRLGAMAV